MKALIGDRPGTDGGCEQGSFIAQPEAGCAHEHNQQATNATGNAAAGMAEQGDGQNIHQQDKCGLASAQQQGRCAKEGVDGGGQGEQLGISSVQQGRIAIEQGNKQQRQGDQQAKGSDQPLDPARRIGGGCRGFGAASGQMFLQRVFGEGHEYPWTDSLGDYV
jgi:hypothetical protein